MTHTPAPWNIEEATCINGGGFKYITGADGRDVCDLYSRSDSGSKVRGYDFPNADDNAHLIAAAPELLEALEGLCSADYIKEDCSIKRQEYWAKANEAIAKAKGEQ